MVFMRAAAVLLLTGTMAAGTLRGQSTQDADWSRVKVALDQARQAWDRDCPNDACSASTTATHRARVAAYERAGNLLANYLDKWKDALDDGGNARIRYRLGWVSDGAEDHRAAAAYYKTCSTAPVEVTYREDHRDQQLRVLCARALADECKSFGYCGTTTVHEYSTNSAHADAVGKSGADEEDEDDSDDAPDQ